MAELTNIYRRNKADNGDAKTADHRVFTNAAFEGDTQNGEILPTTGNHHDDRDAGDRTDDDDDDDASDNGCSRAVGRIQKALSSFVKAYSRILRIIFYVVLVMAYYAYFSYCMYYRFGDEGSWRLMVITVIFSVGIFINLILKHFRPISEAEFNFDGCFQRIDTFLTKIRFSIVLPVLLTLGIGAFVIVDIAIDRPRNLISFAGLVFYICALFIFSHNPSKVKWRPVFWGVALQVIFALLTLRTWWGREAFSWLGDRVTELLNYTDAGSKFVFGELYINHKFAFQVLPVVVYFSTLVAILYYLGVMQAVIKQLGRFLAFCLGTSPMESVNAAGNIFLGQTEAPLLIRPFLQDMTKSEIHAVMTGGFATIAGSVMAAYIILHVPANHLLSASVMSAPAALAMSKLFYPETEKTKHKASDVFNIAKGTERNIIEAASNGASMSITLVANIAVNLLAFLAMLQFVNATLVWLGDRAGYDQLTFQLICSYIFWPLAYLMGIDLEDCKVVAQLIGTKTFINEFAAYADLSDYINNRVALTEYLANFTANVTANLTGNWFEDGHGLHLPDIGEVLAKGLISPRSVVITTYALCGFSNLSSMGIQLGALGAMAPERKSDMSKIVFRAMVAGNVACFMTACVAGLFYEEA